MGHPTWEICLSLHLLQNAAVLLSSFHVWLEVLSWTEHSGNNGDYFLHKNLSLLMHSLVMSLDIHNWITTTLCRSLPVLGVCIFSPYCMVYQLLYLSVDHKYMEWHSATSIWLRRIPKMCCAYSSQGYLIVCTCDKGRCTMKLHQNYNSLKHSSSGVNKADGSVLWNLMIG